MSTFVSFLAQQEHGMDNKPFHERVCDFAPLKSFKNKNYCQDSGIFEKLFEFIENLILI